MGFGSGEKSRSDCLFFNLFSPIYELNLFDLEFSLPLYRDPAMTTFKILESARSGLPKEIAVDFRQKTERGS